MSGLAPLLDSHDLVPPLDETEAELAARELAQASGLAILSRSIAAKDGRVYFLARRNGEKVLCIMAKEAPTGFDGHVKRCDHGAILTCPLTHENAEFLRRTLPYTAPICLGTRPSIGTGDRLGLATPGHIRAVRNTGMFPVLAQQSIREMTRTGRSPENVMDDATWGVFEEGYRDGFGADADHLKTADDIERTFSAGFRSFTIDPGEYVDNAAETDDARALKTKLKKLPWDVLESDADAFQNTWCEQTFAVGVGMDLPFSTDQALRAAVKYGRAVAHTVAMYRRLETLAGGQPFEMEMSVDETDAPTTIREHFYVAQELQRLGVRVAGLAPRFVGAFEKGIDYKGDLAEFEADFSKHVKVAKHFGGYKISIHSGSDKFSIYPIIAKHAGALAHVKTAGTSYLEELRTTAQVAPLLFREIYAFALERYDEDKATYHVSARPEALPSPESLSDDRLASLLEVDDGRQVLHVTYGSVLSA